MGGAKGTCTTDPCREKEGPSWTWGDGAVSQERAELEAPESPERGVRREGIHTLPSIPQGPCAGDFIASL